MGLMIAVFATGAVVGMAVGMLGLGFVFCIMAASTVQAMEPDLSAGQP